MAECDAQHIHEGERATPDDSAGDAARGDAPRRRALSGARLLQRDLRRHPPRASTRRRRRSRSGVTARPMRCASSRAASRSLHHRGTCVARASSSATPTDRRTGRSRRGADRQRRACAVGAARARLQAGRSGAGDRERPRGGRQQRRAGLARGVRRAAGARASREGQRTAELYGPASAPARGAPTARPRHSPVPKGRRGSSPRRPTRPAVRFRSAEVVEHLRSPSW